MQSGNKPIQFLSVIPIGEIQIALVHSECKIHIALRIPQLHLWLREKIFVLYRTTGNLVFEETQRVHNTPGNNKRIAIEHPIVIFHRDHHIATEIVIYIFYIGRVTIPDQIVLAGRRTFHLNISRQRVLTRIIIVHTFLSNGILFPIENQRFEKNHLFPSDIVNTRLYNHTGIRRKKLFGNFHTSADMKIISFHFNIGGFGNHIVGNSLGRNNYFFESHCRMTKHDIDRQFPTDGSFTFFISQRCKQ